MFVHAIILLQGFNWESWKQSGGWYNMMMGKVDDIAAAGVTHVWLPPPSHSVSTQGPSLSRPNSSVPQHLEAIEAWSGEHAKFDCD